MLEIQTHSCHFRMLNDTDFPNWEATQQYFCWISHIVVLTNFLCPRNKLHFTTPPARTASTFAFHLQYSSYFTTVLGTLLITTPSSHILQVRPLSIHSLEF
jgi:hypothetical protein